MSSDEEDPQQAEGSVGGEEQYDDESDDSMDSGDEEADDWDDELGDIDDLSDPESDLEDSLPVATTEQVPGKQAYLDSCARQRIIPVSAFIKSMGQNKVSLRHYLLGEQGAIAVAESLQLNSTIVSLDLSDTWLGVEGAEHVSEALKDNVEMEYLDVSDNRLGFKGGLAMASLLRENGTLKDVCLSGNKLCDRVAVEVSNALTKNSTLTRLDLSRNDIADKGGAAIGEMLLSNGELKDVDLSWNNILAKGGKKLVESINYNKTLTVLDLGWNGIGDEAGAMLEAALKDNDVLRHLDLSNNRLSSSAAAAIANGVKDNKGLVSLVVDHNPFGAQGCELIMDSLKQNPAIINVGLHNVEPEANFATLDPPPADAPASAGGAAPPISPRNLLTPRQVWARKPVQLKVPDDENPTGYYRFNLSKPWERLAAERLAKVEPREGIQPLATISPNLAPGKDGRPFDLKRNASGMPDSGILQVKFQMMVHPPRQTTIYKLKLDDKKDQAVAKRLREKASDMMHDEFGSVELDGRLFGIPLSEEAKWVWPEKGELKLGWISPELIFEIPLKLNLVDTLDRGVAELLLTKVLKDTAHEWPAGSASIDGEPYTPEPPKPGTPLLPPTGELIFKHVVNLTAHDATDRVKFDLKEGGDGRAQAEELNKKLLSTPGINLLDVTLGGKPYELVSAPKQPTEEEPEPGPEEYWVLPPKGVLEMDVITLSRMDTGVPASHGAVLRVEESLADKKNDSERIAELQKTMRKEATAWFAADQAGKLIETFRSREARERALGMLLPQIIHINHFEQLRGCFDGVAE
eukprot:SAG22_NODE_840_length_6896_cov_3.900103_3_plen_805_part_00